MPADRGSIQDELGKWRSDLAVALSLLTTIPLRQEQAAAPEHARATRLYPLAGLLVGLAGGGVHWLASAIGLPPLAAGLLAVGATILVTGAFHEDGLGDLADGLGGGRDKARKLEIMRDSRVGTYGALALILSVGLRAAALAALTAPAAVTGALVAAHVISRAALPAIMSRTPLARESGLAADTGRPTPGHAGTALALGAIVTLVALDFGVGLTAFLTAGLAALAVLWLARMQIGGYTGDVLGAIQQVAEATVLLTVVALEV